MCKLILPYFFFYNNVANFLGSNNEDPFSWKLDDILSNFHTFREWD